MEFTLKRTMHVMAILLIAAAVTQAIYTALYIAEANVPRQLLWGSEGLIFVLLAAFAGSALADSKRYSLGFSAILVAATLNVVQVGVGLTLFGSFGETASAVDGFGPAMSGIVAYSFMVYNAAKILLGLAALVFGMAKMAQGAKALGGLTAIVGVFAMIANTASMAMGREVFGELPLAGGSGVVATLLLAVCLMGTVSED
jgi:hypothetical protein